CPKNGDVQQFLADLCSHHTELKSMGVTINNDDYQSTIIGSLPWALTNFALMQLLAATLYPSLSGGTIEPDCLINMICDEW
ncbi:hypothetical protein P691DRAFT_627796, partial [Macrolepiota fuliginosa MF-IS2]